MRKNLTSVGIDIGTTTCHLVFSNLVLANSSAADQIPKLFVQERKVLYESPVFFTPLKDDGSIDGNGVSDILKQEYASSGFKPDDIDCGAVIITGETARLRNAKEVLHEISSLAGDFVAASAGPELESILAGRGSGAMQRSRESGKTICNIDIGGGTTNIVIFEGGDVRYTDCLRIGARSFRFNRDGTLACVASSGEVLLERFSEEPAERFTSQNWITLARRIVKSIFDSIRIEDVQPPPTPAQKGGGKERQIDEYWFSGGVAELMKRPGEDRFLYEDFGWILAKTFNEFVHEKKIVAKLPEHPLRATVLGAGSYSMQLSGNTVSINTTRLPVKTIPLVRPFHGMSGSESKEISHRIKHCLATLAVDGTPQVAIVLDTAVSPTYAQLKEWSVSLTIALEENQVGSPYIVIVASDAAMALGQLLKGQLKQKDLIVLDGLDLDYGDYIDIGKPIGGGTTIPVTIKSLVFAND